MEEKNEQLTTMRHSMAHIMAAAIKELWPNTKFGVGPAVKNGFYYDVDLGDNKISENDFKKIEDKMHSIIAEKLTFERIDLDINEAIKWADDNNQIYKADLLNDLKKYGTTNINDLKNKRYGESVSDVTFYKIGNFTDLCKGPHISNTGDAGFFKLIDISGVYWRGKEGNNQLQRLLGVAFLDKESLDKFIESRELAKERDHRKIGKELDLFTFSPLVGPGLPLFTPRGTILREKLGAFSQQLQEAAGYQRVSIPHMTKIDLYKKSGHYDKYPERFEVTSVESEDKFMLKPMNCPHHAQIYASRPRSYKDLPVRYMENTIVYRDEKAGELHGLSRVRGATQDDAHVFCRADQIEQEFTSIMNMIRVMYKQFGLSWRARLSFRDSTDKYLGDGELWDYSQGIIKNVAEKMKLDYFIAEGEAAFYGPKIDIMATDALGREWQLATEQLDFVQPERFDLKYTDANGEEQRPVMIHKALLGSLERFMSVYIEHTAGWFPMWMAPEQVRILTINDQVSDYVDLVKDKLSKILFMKPVKYNELRFNCDDRNESLGRKIKDANAWKVPLQLIIGPKDKDKGVVSVRGKNINEVVDLDKLEEFILNVNL
jgi:threonyl-tRNA synthetase